jgi:cell division protein FtsA
MPLEHARQRAGGTTGAPPEVVVAVDVGTARVACAVAETGDGMPRVVAAESAASFGIRGGEIVDLRRAGEAIRIAIEAAADSADAEVRTVVTGLSGDVKLSTLKVALEMDREHRTVCSADVERLRRSLNLDPGARRRAIHRFDGPFNVGDLLSVERPEGLSGDRVEMQASFLSASSDRLDNLLRAVRSAGVEIEAVSLEPFSCSIGALSEEERMLGAAVLDLGAGAFRGALWEGGRLRQLQVIGRETGGIQSSSGHYVAPVGGMEGVVLSLARRFRVAPVTAERLIRSHGVLGDEELTGLPEAVEAAAVDGLGSVRVETRELSRTLEELLSPVARGLREGLSGFSAGHTVGVVLTGGGAHIRGMPAWLSKRFGGAVVRMGTPRWTVADGVKLPPELEGARGCSLCGLISVGAKERTEMRRRSHGSWLGWLTGLVRRVAASY